MSMASQLHQSDMFLGVDQPFLSAKAKPLVTVDRPRSPMASQKVRMLERM